MRCDDAQMLLSARVDGDAPERGEELDAHLEGCPACSDWLDRAHAMKRAALTVAQSSAAPAVTSVPRGFVWHRWARAILTGAAVALLGWNLPEMMTAGSEAAVHLARHQAAFGVALGLAFLFVAWRPDRAYGMVPFAIAFTVALGSVALIDLFNGVSTLAREARHIVEIVGLGVLWQLGAAAGPGRRRDQQRVDVLRTPRV